MTLTRHGYREVPVGRDYAALVDAKDYDRVVEVKWNVHRSCTTIYARSSELVLDGRKCRVLLHRFILRPKRHQRIDHVNHNGLDNRRANLRIAGHSDNAMNRIARHHREGTLKGVSKKPGHEAWSVEIGVNGDRVHLGDFTDPLHAAIAYDAAAKAAHREFAFTNRDFYGEDLERVCERMLRG